MPVQLTICTPDREKLRGLDSTSATKLFRALLYADAGRLRLEEIRVSIDETNTADGGIDGPDGEMHEDATPQAKVAELADELLKNIGSPDDALAMVLCSDGHRIAHFGTEVAKRALASHDRLILQTAFNHSQRARAGFFFGYMSQVWTSAPKRWERMALSLMAETGGGERNARLASRRLQGVAG